MDFGLSTYLFADQRLNSHALGKILAAGFRRVEVFAARQHLDYRDTNQVRDVAQWFADHPLELYSVHAPLFNDVDWGRSGGLAISIAYLERRLRVDSADEIKRALEMAELMPFRYLVLHLGLNQEEFDQRKLDAAFSALEHLRIFAKERGVRILLENVPNELSTPPQLVDFIRYTHLDVGVCFDIGHAHLAGGVQAAFNVVKEKIASVHMHDNHSVKDEHLMPFEGEIDWNAAVRDLHSLEGCPTILELSDFGIEAKGFDPVKRVTERLLELEEKARQETASE